MKKTILLIVACVITFATVRAQSSEVEATTKLTKAEQFKLTSSLIKEELIYKYENKHLCIYTQLFTDLEIGEQLVALEFRAPLPGILKSATDVIFHPLGYLDMEQIDDLLLALEMILEESNNSEKKDRYSITYTTPGGIDIYYTNGVTLGVVNTTPVVSFRKKWFKLDEYGVQTSTYSEAEATLDIKDLPQLISGIKEAQIVCKKELAERTPLTKSSILAKAAAKKEAQAEAEAEEFRKAEEIKAEEARIAEEKRKEANATDLYKKEVTTSIVQVQQEYTKLELTDSPIFTAYKKAISKLMQSRVLRDWETLDVINTVMQNLIKENCSIDKTALETQLAEKTTPEEIIEVFKASL